MKVRQAFTCWPPSGCWPRPSLSRRRGQGPADRRRIRKLERQQGVDRQLGSASDKIGSLLRDQPPTSLRKRGSRPASPR